MTPGFAARRGLPAPQILTALWRRKIENNGWISGFYCLPLCLEPAKKPPVIPHISARRLGELRIGANFPRKKMPDFPAHFSLGI
jgi:hypothetical protein